MNVAIITARAGSKSIYMKNILPINGKPLLAYVIEVAKAAKGIEKIYVDTDGEEIAKVAEEYGAEVLKRPVKLSGDHVNHGDVIKYAVECVQKINPNLQNVALLIGNTVMIDEGLIDNALEILSKNVNLDSVMSVWEAADDHPFRALTIVDGLLQPFGQVSDGSLISTERQSYPKVYFYDQGVWVFRWQNVKERLGPRPWWWMGRNVYPIIRPWITGRDINGPFDVPFHELWVSEKYRFTEAIVKQVNSDLNQKHGVTQ